MNWSDIFWYEQDSGKLFRRPRQGSSSKWLDFYNRSYAGKEVGTTSNERSGKYRTFVYNGKAYKAHRVIWEMTNGPIPSGHSIDHVDGNGLNNRISNLRLTTHAENLRNRKPQKNNPYGLKGVSYCKATGMWVSYITVSGKRIQLGSFRHKCLAAVAYAKGALVHHGRYARITTSHKPL